MTKAKLRNAPRKNRTPAIPAKRSRTRRAKETEAERLVRISRILSGLHECYPRADCALKHRNAFELLVATILSAQCTDDRVNLTTPELFRRYPGPAELARAAQAELEVVIRSTGFFRNKAKSLIGMAQGVMQRFGGEVPAQMKDLLCLPGVARKTANVVLGTWFGKNEGIVVDTHVGRLATRLGLLSSARSDKDAVRIEQDLQPIIPRDEWTYFSHALIWHGRRVCMARKPNCPGCRLAADCPSAHAMD